MKRQNVSVQKQKQKQTEEHGKYVNEVCRKQAENEWKKESFVELL